MLEQNLLKQITKIKILKEERKVKKKDNKVTMKNNNNKKKLKLFHFDNLAFTMTILPRKFVHQIFWFPKHTLYFHRELICYH